MKTIVSYIMLSCIVVVLCVFACMSGSVDIASMDKADLYILWQIRMPRTLMCIVCGASLSVCGTAYQAVFRNPLSDPYVLGVSSGASLGAACAIVIGLDSFLLGVPLSAFVFAMLSVLLIMKLSKAGNRMHTATLILAGVSFNFLFSALISLLMSIEKEQMQKIYFWTMGSLSGIQYSDVSTVGIITVLGLSVLGLYGKRMNALSLGDLPAQSLGVDVEKTKKTILVVATFMTASVVSYCGVIGFIGLVVPHITRLLVGADNKKILPYSVFGGMIFMLLSDIIARNIVSPGELPIGVVTSLVGAPFFLYLLYNAKQKLHF